MCASVLFGLKSFRNRVGGLTVEKPGYCDLGARRSILEKERGGKERLLTWAFHCERCSKGIACVGSWAVIEVTCSSACRCASDSWSSDGGGVMLLLLEDDMWQFWFAVE